MITKFISSVNTYSAILTKTVDYEERNFLFVFCLFDKFLLMHTDMVSSHTVLSEKFVQQNVYKEGIFKLYPYQIKGNRIVSQFREGTQTYTIEFEETFWGNLLFSYSVHGMVMDWERGVNSGIQKRELFKKEKLIQYYGGGYSHLIPELLRVLNIQIYTGQQHERSLFIPEELNPFHFVQSMIPLANVLKKEFADYDYHSMLEKKINDLIFIQKYGKDILDQLLQLHLVQNNRGIHITKRGVEMILIAMKMGI